MAGSKPISQVAIIGTGVIGASWAALFLAKGLDVVATDVAPNAEASLRRFVDAAWPALERLGLAPGASPMRLVFTADLTEAVQGCRSRPGERTGADRLQEEAVRSARRTAAIRCDHRVELVGPDDERDPIRCPLTPGALRHRASVQSAASGPVGRDRRRCEDLRGDDPARFGILHGSGQENSPPAQGSAWSCRQPAASCPGPGGVSSGGRGRRQCRRRRHRGQLGTGTALGYHGLRSCSTTSVAARAAWSISCSNSPVR